MPTLALVLRPRALMTSVALPLEMFRAADELDRVQRRGRSRLRVEVVTSTGEPLTGPDARDEGPGYRPTCEVNELGQVDLLFLSASWRRPVPTARERRVTIPLLERLAPGTTLCAATTGSFLLAASGLLDARPATTHWSFFDDFARLYPKVHLRRDHLVTRSGRLYCAGSVNAVGDLASHLIEEHYGPWIARQVVAQFSPEIRSELREHAFFDGETNAQSDELMADAQQWLHEFAAEAAAISELARNLGISQRSLNRRFRTATGMTPLRYRQLLRMRAAAELLRGTNLSIGEISLRAGYRDRAHFSRLFHREMAQSPAAYRRAVRAKLFEVAASPVGGGPRGGV